MARGWFGDKIAHRKIGKKGGDAPHAKRGLQAASKSVRKRVASLGGKSKRRDHE